MEKEKQFSKKELAKAILFLVVAMVLSFSIKDVIDAFAEAFLPQGEVLLQIPEQKEKTGRTVMIVWEGNSKELFKLFRQRINNNPGGTGWEYIEGQEGVSWTRIVSSQPGARIGITSRKNPDYFITVLKSRWNDDFEMVVDGGEPERINCYDENTDGELLRIYPYKDYTIKRNLKIIFHLIAFISFYAYLRAFVIWLHHDDSENNEARL